MSGFDVLYQGTPLWDIGRPQGKIVELANQNVFQDPILDVGCGTGENALYLAGMGYDVVGVDSAPTAIRKANEKSQKRNLEIEFKVLDALKLNQLERKFHTVIDSGLFHIFENTERKVFTEQIAEVLHSQGMYYFICFSELEPGQWGPRRVTQSEIHSSFSALDLWKLISIDSASFEINLPQGKVAAWFAAIMRQ